MKKMKKCAGILLMLAVLVGFTSCQDDETIFDKVVGRTWVGDLGFGPNNDLVESGVYLGGDGFGTDEQLYVRDKTPRGTYNITWEVVDGSIFIRYGNRAAIRELRNVYVSNGQINAALFVDRVFVADVVLRRD